MSLERYFTCSPHSSKVLDSRFQVDLADRRFLVKILPLVALRVPVDLLALADPRLVLVDRLRVEDSRDRLVTVDTPLNRGFSMSVLSSREKFLRDQLQSALPLSLTS